MGIWALFLTLTGIFETIKTGLLKNAHIKYASGSTDQQEKVAIASSSLLINVFLSLIFILFIIFFSNWLAAWYDMGAQFSSMFKWYIPGLLFLVFFSHLEAIQQSFLDFKGVFAGYFVRQISFFIVIVVYTIFKIPFSLIDLVIYQSLSTALGTIVFYIFTRKYLDLKFKATRLWIKKLSAYGSHILGSGVVANIYSNLDQLMVGKLLNTEAIAVYAIPQKINGLVDIPSYAAADILFPKTSQAATEEGPGKVKYLFERMVAILIAFTVPTAIFVIIFPKFVIHIIAGDAYATAAPILQLYMLAGIFRPLQNQAANLLNSIGKAKLVLIINSVSLVLLLGINYLCLLEFGFYGAAIGTCITSVSCMIIWYFVMKKAINLDMLQVLKYTRDTYEKIFELVAKVLLKRKKAM